MEFKLLIFIVGLALIGAGVAVAALSIRNLSSGADTINITKLANSLNDSWWPWAVCAIGIVATLVPLFHFLRYISPRRAKRLLSLGSDPDLSVQLKAASDVTRRLLLANPEVKSTRIRTLHDRRQTVIGSTVTINSDSKLSTISAIGEAISVQLVSVIGRNDVLCRMTIKSPRRPRKTSN
jgi:divalent metal cation (Fe/Co/Zn/Cd) transporter